VRLTNANSEKRKAAALKKRKWIRGEGTRASGRRGGTLYGNAMGTFTAKGGTSDVSGVCAVVLPSAINDDGIDDDGKARAGRQNGQVQCEVLGLVIFLGRASKCRSVGERASAGMQKRIVKAQCKEQTVSDFVCA